MAVKDLGRVVPLFRGTWSTPTSDDDSYDHLDMVYNDGSTWVCLHDNVYSEPTDGSTDWQLVCRAMIGDEQLQQIEADVMDALADEGYVMDPDYVHTDENFTSEYKEVLDNYEPPTTGNPFHINVLNDSISLYLIPGQRYSFDNTNWVDVSEQAVVNVEAGQTLWLDCTSVISVGLGFKILGESGSARYEVAGDILSLHYPDYAKQGSMRDSEFERLFANCHGLNTNGLVLPDFVSPSCYRHMFNSCRSLTTAPALPATTLASECYRGMFFNCNSLTTAPELPATTLTRYCYCEMFRYTGLTSAPTLPATVLAEGCYQAMFYHCNALVTPPALPAMRLDRYCYKGIFQGCTALTTPPALPAMEMQEECYNSMFYNCTALTTTPTLPATSLAGNCYRNLFRGCTSLTKGPVLPATQPQGECYGNMFQGCTSITEVWCYLIIPDGENPRNWVGGWLDEVGGTGTVHKNQDNTNWLTDDGSGTPTGWTTVDDEVVVPEGNNWFRMTAHGGSIRFSFRFENDRGSGEMSMDGTTWEEAYGWEEKVITLSDGQTLYLRSKDDTCNTCVFFNGSVQDENAGLILAGDIRSLYYRHYTMFDTLSGYADTRFRLGDIPMDASAMTLGFTYMSGDGGMDHMFRECYGLTLPPQCPIVGVINSSRTTFLGMFEYCSSLQRAMNISRLVSITNRDGVQEHFSYMYNGCNQMTDITGAMPGSACYSKSTFKNMFESCSSITTIPDSFFYTPDVIGMGDRSNMFAYCYNLQSIKMYEWFPHASGWLDDVNNKTMYLPVGAQPYESLQDRSYNGIPESWTIQYF